MSELYCETQLGSDCDDDDYLAKLMAENKNREPDPILKIIMQENDELNLRDSLAAQPTFSKQESSIQDEKPV